MPGLPQRNVSYSSYSSTCCSANGSISSNGIWSKHRDDVSFDQLQKFWSELKASARQELLRIDKQTLLEQARKNLYCSRCNGLLLEGFSQIAMHKKSMQLDNGKSGNNQIENGVNGKSLTCQDDSQDPAVHHWGGLVITREGILTLLDCFLEAKSLKALQNVFNGARVRERERELLYPDACGGGGRGWISQGVANYGRGHGTRETCALHTARLSCDTLVEYWSSSIGDEARRNLLRMKEEDFIERLMYRFDSKRFCRDCRRNVIREFKELKELKRMRREPRCTSWFCVADTAFQYEVSDDMVLADWHQYFNDTFGTYHHFEWAVGTGEGKSDILEFEDVGMNGSVQVNGLDLGDLNACFITLRAWKLDGRCTELSVKAHAMKGQACVHRRLVVGDGYVTITKGESIRRFFEHAEEAEEEEDDESMDKDGNEMDGEGSRPQKHAKSPELAREFLLDAATVIFKEQVEKAFREATARQNAHSIFVCLALKLLEDRIHVACKEIITLEKQTKLLEEEEREKRHEEERKERRRTKEREKKLRRRERLKGKERQKEDSSDLKQNLLELELSKEDSSPSIQEESNNSVSSEDSVSETGENDITRPLSPDTQEDQSSDGCIVLETEILKGDDIQHTCNVFDSEINTRDGNGLFVIEQSKSSRRKMRFQKDYHFDADSRWAEHNSEICSDNGALVDEYERKSHGGCMTTPSRSMNGVNRQYRNNFVKSSTRVNGSKFSEKFHGTHNRMRDIQSYNCSSPCDYQAKDDRHASTGRTCREVKNASGLESSADLSRTFYRNSKYTHGCYTPADGCSVTKTKLTSGNFPLGREMFHAKKVWEPIESRKLYPRSNSDSDVTLRASSLNVGECEDRSSPGDKMECQGPRNVHNQSVGQCLNESLKSSDKVEDVNGSEIHLDECVMESRSSSSVVVNICQSGPCKDIGDEEPCPMVSTCSMTGMCDPVGSHTSSSDNCSSCLSEGDSSTASSSHNAESWSTSDSEESSQQLDGREASSNCENGFQKMDDKHMTNGVESPTSIPSSGSPVASCGAGGTHMQRDSPTKNTQMEGRIAVDMGSQQHRMIPPMFNQGIHMPMIPAPSTMAYYHQNPTSWSTAPVSPFHQANRYLFSTPVGYGLPVSQPSHLCMQYSPLQPVPTSMLNVGQHPAYQSPFQNGITAGTVVKDSPAERPGLSSQTTQQGAEARRTGISSKLPGESTNFSLFHFGGPIAAGTGADANSPSVKKGAGRDYCTSIPADCNRGLTCSEKGVAVEEYSLFAGNTGTRFPFF